MQVLLQRNGGKQLKDSHASPGSMTPFPHTAVTHVHSFGRFGRWQNWPAGHVGGKPFASHSSSASFRPSPQIDPQSEAVAHGMPGFFVRSLQNFPAEPTARSPLAGPRR